MEGAWLSGPIFWSQPSFQHTPMSCKLSSVQSREAIMLMKCWARMRLLVVSCVLIFRGVGGILAPTPPGPIIGEIFGHTNRWRS